jgi:hypothetical protein
MQPSKWQEHWEQIEISDAVGVIGEDDLPGIATLRHRMRNIGDHDVRQASDEGKY